MAMNIKVKPMETIVVEDGRTLDAIVDRDPKTYRLICKRCGSEIQFAPTFKRAAELHMSPGAFCTEDERHFKVHYNLTHPKMDAILSGNSNPGDISHEPKIPHEGTQEYEKLMEGQSEAARQFVNDMIRTARQDKD